MIRILVVDDEEDLAGHLIRMLRRQGWEAGAAYDGVEATLKVMDGGWDAVLMDIRMPNLNGLVECQGSFFGSRLRKRPCFQALGRHTYPNYEP